MANEIVKTNRIERVSDNTAVAGIDSIANTLETIELEHHEVHEGNFYTISDYDNDVDIIAPKYWHLKTPDTVKRIHIKMEVGANGADLVEFFETPTLTGNGTALTPKNNDRNSANATTLLVYYDPTVTADGTRITADLIGTNNNKTIIGGSIRNGAEFILKRNTSYLVKFSPVADNTKATFKAEFYEI